MPKVVCKSVILCDEIRQENNGKYLIIGAYSSGIAVKSMPAQLGISLYLTLEFAEAGQYQVFVEAAHAQHKAQIGVDLEITTTKYPMVVPMPQVPMVLTEVGELIVSVGLSRDELTEAARFEVALNPEIWTMYPTELSQLGEQSQTDEPD